MDNNKQIKQPDVETRCLTAELRAAATESRTITGYAARFDSWSEPIMGWFKEKIDRCAFEDCDVTDVVMCFNHNIDSILARTASDTLHIETDDKGLHFSFEAPDTTLGNDMLALVRRGDISKCSFKFTVEADEWRYADKENKLEYDERTVLRISRLYDVSLVVYPAYQDTEASARHLEERKAEWLKAQTLNQDNDEQDQQQNTTDSDAGATNSDPSVVRTDQGMAVNKTQDLTSDSPVDTDVAQSVDSSHRTRLTEQLKLKNR